MNSKKIISFSVLSAVLALAGCGGSIPNTSGQYEYEEGGAKMKAEITPVSPDEGKYFIKLFRNGHEWDEGVMVYVKDSKGRFCQENPGWFGSFCFDYDKAKGIRVNNQAEFSKKLK